MKMEKSISWNNSENDSAQTSFKENMTPQKEVYADELDNWDTA